MNRLLLIAIAALLTTNVMKAQKFIPLKQIIEEDLSITMIDTNVYIAEHSFPWPGNTLIIKFNGGQYLWANTTYTDKGAEKLVNWLQERDTDKVRISVVNTHFHLDNLGGNGFLVKNGAKVYGSDLTVKLLADENAQARQMDLLGDPSLKKYLEYYKDYKFTPPSIVFPLSAGLHLVFGHDTIEVFYPGPGHTRDNVVVYYPSKHILFGGCFVKSMESKSKGNISDADLTAWPSSLDLLSKKFPEAEIVIPGHGRYGGKELITHTLEIINK